VEDLDIHHPDKLMIQIEHTDARTLISTLASGSVTGVMADPPWSYTNSGHEGGVARQYAAISIDEIAEILDLTWDSCGSDAYLIVWCTWPKLIEWVHSAKSMRWRYVSGGAWTKSNGFGIGTHHAGDSECWLTYVKGSPRPADGRQSNASHADRIGHSEKPQDALEKITRTIAPEHGLILDPFAGESASLARCCARLGRSYIGAELSADRHASALRRLRGYPRKTARASQVTSMFDILEEKTK